MAMNPNSAPSLMEQLLAERLEMHRQTLPTHVNLAMTIESLTSFLEVVANSGHPSDWIAAHYGVKTSDVEVLRRGNYKLIVEDPQ